MGGFKGLANMSMEELQAEYDHFAEEVWGFITIVESLDKIESYTQARTL
jgi:hypothetical protein